MRTATLPLALVMGALALTSNVYAAQLDKIAMDQPVVKVVGHDRGTDAPIEDVTVVARVIPEPDTLTTDSGVALLNDYVNEAARKACFAADPMTPDDGTCYHKAIKAARPQVAALVARAKAEKDAGTKVAAN